MHVPSNEKRLPGLTSFICMVAGGLLTSAVLLLLSVKLAPPFDTLVPWVVFLTWLALILIGLLHIFLLVINTHQNQLPQVYAEPAESVAEETTDLESQRYLPDVDTLRKAYRPLSKNQIFIIDEGVVSPEANTWQATRQRLLGAPDEQGGKQGEN